MVSIIICRFQTLVLIEPIIYLTDTVGKVISAPIPQSEISDSTPRFEKKPMILLDYSSKEYTTLEKAKKVLHSNQIIWVQNVLKNISWFDGQFGTNNILNRK